MNIGTFTQQLRLPKRPMIWLSALLLVLMSSSAWGQVSMTNSSAVVENFTSFAGAASPTNWTVQGTGSGGTTWRGTTQTSGTSGGWYGNANMSFLGSGTASAGNATWLLQNNTGSTITGFTLAFVGTLWKTGSASPSVTVTWSNSSSSTNPAQGALGNSLSSLTFNDATTNVATGASLTQSVSSLTIANGQYIFIRFIHPGGSNSDNLGWDGVTFTPTLAPASHTVTFDANGGSGTMTAQSSASSANLTSNSFTRTGYAFNGWYTTANGSGGTAYADGESYSFAADVTLYAQWSANSNTITFDGNTNTGGSTASQNINTAASANLTANGFTKTGYTFAGWATSAGGAVAYVNQASYTMGTGNVTLYAKWTANSNTITFDGNGSDGGSTTAQNINTDASANLTANGFTRTGYAFNGWNTAANGSGTAYTNQASYSMGTSSVTLYAQWTLITSPTLSGASTATAFTTTYGTASTAQSFSISGSNLTEAIVATAPTGLQVSRDGGTTYQDTVWFDQSSGTASGTLKIRLKATAAVSGSYNSQNIALTSAGATTINITTAASGNAVTAKGLTITGLSASDKTYDGGTSVSVTGTPAYSGLENGESFSISGSPTWAFTTKTAGNSKAITQTDSYAAPSTNYTVTQPTLTANINTIALTISGAAVTSKSYDGSATATITGTLTGVISPDVVSFTGTGAFASANAGTGIGVTANCTLTGADKDNYTLTQPTSLTGDINKANQTITFAALSNKTTTDAPFALTASASSGLTVSYSSSNTGVATVSGSTVTIVGIGTTIITASQTGDGNYNAATSVDQSLTVTAQDLVEVIFPQYIQGVNGTNSNRIPFASYLTLNNLSANATYRYYCGVVISSDGATSSGAGNNIYPDYSGGSFVRSSGPSLSTSGNYGTFTTNTDGSFTGWFILEPTGNATRFVPGNTVNLRITLNDGNGGTTAASYRTTTNTAKVINLVASAGANNGTGLRSTSYASSKNFAVLYDNTSGTGRPISASFIESDGSANTTANSYASFYNGSVNGVSGAFGVVVPNTNSNGIKRIEFKSLSDNSLIYAVSDNDGNWGGAVNTVNPTGGTTELVLPTTNFDDATVNSNLNLSASTTFNGTLTINSSKALSIGDGNTLIVNTISGTGTISTSSTSNLTINGSNAGTVYFTSGSNSLHEFTLGNSASVILGSALNMTSAFGLLTLGTNATLTTGGYLTLKSNSFGTAKVAALPSGASISGNVTVERFIPNKTSRKYSFLASSVSQTVANSWQQQIHVTGPGTGGTSCQSGSSSSQPTTNSNGFDASGTNSPTIFYYDQSATPKWNSIPNTATTLTPGIGYRVLIRGTRVLGCSLLFTNPPAPDSVTLSATGTLTQGNVDISVAGNSGFTMLGNPYAADFDFTQFRADNSSVLANNFWTYSPQKASGTYSAYNLSTGIATNFPNGISNHTIIAPGQAFFVQSQNVSSPTVHFYETQKAGTFQPGMFKTTQPTDRVRVSLFSSTNTTESIDESVVDYNTNGSLSFDPEWDTRSMNSGNMIASMKAGEKLAIQSRPTMTPSANDTVGLFVDGAVATYSLGFTEHTNFIGDVYLLDKYNNTIQDVKATPNYSFAITTDTLTKGANRFALLFKAMHCKVKIKTVNGNTACEPNAVQFIIDSNATAYSNVDLQWNLNGSPISGATDSVYSVNSVGGGNISLTVSWTGCNKTSNNKAFTIKPQPTATFSVTGATTFCAGGSVTLTAPTISGYSYTWYNNGTSIGSGASKIIKTAGDYTVVAKLNGCSSDPSNAATVQVNPLPVAGIAAATATTFCAGDNCSLNATPTGGVNYDWINGTITENTGSNATFTTNIAGKYKVIVTDNNGCISKASANSITTKVNPIPVATITATGATTISSTGTVKLNAMPSSGVSWQWYKDGSPIANATAKQYIATTGGNYSVAVTKTGCTGMSTPTVVTQTTPKQEIGTTNGSFVISAYPNPVNELLTVNVSGIANATEASIEIMNAVGERVFSGQLSITNELGIDMKNFVSGIYFVRYKDNEGRTGTVKIVKE